MTAGICPIHAGPHKPPSGRRPPAPTRIQPSASTSKTPTPDHLPITKSRTAGQLTGFAVREPACVFGLAGNCDIIGSAWLCSPAFPRRETNETFFIHKPKLPNNPFPFHHLTPPHAGPAPSTCYISKRKDKRMPRRKPPVSEKQLAANRANAARSTGPRTPQGKARSAQNARKHGFTASTFAVVRLEDLDEVAHLRADLIAVYQPVNSQELFAIERIALAQQAILRAARLETGLFTTCLDEALDPDGEPMRPHEPGTRR